MAISAEERKRLLAANLPESERVRAMARDYMARTGLSNAAFGHRIGYSVPALNNFLCGRYHNISSNDGPIRDAICRFIAANPIAHFSFAAARLYETNNVKLLRKYFYEALEKGRAGCVEGDPGTQKSFVAQSLVHELNQREVAKNGHGRRAYYVYCPQVVTPMQLIRQIAEAVGAIVGADIRATIKNIRFTIGARRSVVLLDEAQHLDIRAMETVRELHDLPPHCGLLFLGSHNFGHKLTANALEMEQWNSRFHFRKSLPGLDESEAREIIKSELEARATREVSEALVRRSRVDHLRSGGKEKYVSARRLFEALKDLRPEPEEAAKGATA